MSILSTLGRLAADFSAARARHHAERTIRALPIELQKDIGWPDILQKPSDHRFGVGSWTGSK